VKPVLARAACQDVLHLHKPLSRTIYSLGIIFCVQRSDGIEVDILPGEIDRIEGRLPFELNSCHSIFNIEDIRDVLQIARHR
jgi:hypothetical protein